MKKLEAHGPRRGRRGRRPGASTCSWSRVEHHEARLTNAVVEKHLGVATNRNLTVVRTLAEKWGDG